MATKTMFTTQITVNGGNHQGGLRADDIKEALQVTPNNVLAGFLLGRLRPLMHLEAPACTKAEGGQVAPSDTFDIVLNFDKPGAAGVLQTAFKQLTTPAVRTPLTRENVLKWATEDVDKHPTYVYTGWNETTRQYENVIGTSTIHHLLSMLLLGHDAKLYADMDKGELLEILLEWCEHGVKGYDDYSVDELLDEIGTDVLDSGLFADVEEMVEQLLTHED
jgi:hypothetical protein